MSRVCAADHLRSRVRYSQIASDVHPQQLSFLNCSTSDILLLQLLPGLLQKDARLDRLEK